MHMTSCNAETPKELTRVVPSSASLALLERCTPRGKQTASAFFFIRLNTMLERLFHESMRNTAPALIRGSSTGPYMLGVKKCSVIWRLRPL